MKRIKNILFILILALLLSFCASEKGYAQGYMETAVWSRFTQTKKNISADSNVHNVQFPSFEKNIFQGEAHTINLLNVPGNCSVTFESSDPSVLDVVQISDTECRYTGIGYGSAKIVAKISENGSFLFFDSPSKPKILHAKFFVSPRAVSIRFRKCKKKLLPGESTKLHLTIRPSISRELPIFQTQNSRIATINSKGIVTAYKNGKTYVTATLANGRSARCKIVVKQTAAALSATPAAQAM